MEATSGFFFWRLIYPKLLKNGGKERKKNHKLPQVIKEGEKTISYPNKGKFYTIYFQNFLQNKIVTYRLQIHQVKILLLMEHWNFTDIAFCHKD